MRALLQMARLQLREHYLSKAKLIEIIASRAPTGWSRTWIGGKKAGSTALAVRQTVEVQLVCANARHDS
jgi:hypothetical protein